MRSLTTLVTVVISASCMAPRTAPRLPHRTPTQLEYRVVSQTISAWIGAGLNSVGRACWDQLGKMKVVTALTHDQMKSYLPGHCGPAAEHLPGCTKHIWAAYTRRFGDPLIVVWGGDTVGFTPAYADLIRHEATHWLQQCTGRGFPRPDSHADPEVWCRSGCVGPIWN